MNMPVRPIEFVLQQPAEGDVACQVALENLRNLNPMALVDKVSEFIASDEMFIIPNYTEEHPI